jgi:hypothetical protein
MSSESLIAHVDGEYVAKDQTRISVFDFGMLGLDGHVTEGPGFNLFAVRGGEMFLAARGHPDGDHAADRVRAGRRARAPGAGSAAHRLSQRVHGPYWALRERGRDGTPIFPESAR